LALALNVQVSAQSLRLMKISSFLMIQSRLMMVRLRHGQVVNHPNTSLRLLEALATELKFSMDNPWKKLSVKAKEAIINGFDYEVHVKYKNRYGRVRNYSTGFEGVVPFIHRRHSETDSDYSRDKYEAYMRETPCPTCKGARLKPEVLAVTLGGKSIAEVCALSIDDCAAFLKEVTLNKREAQIAERVMKEVHARLGFLLDVGLDYLSLDRPAATLSGGEAQRIRLGNPDWLRPCRCSLCTR
jgi:excinuclease ABC subunit A